MTRASLIAMVDDKVWPLQACNIFGGEAACLELPKDKGFEYYCFEQKERKVRQILKRQVSWHMNKLVVYCVYGF